MKHLRGLGVLVLGLGHSGLAMARWCARHGADVRVWDSRDAPPQLGALRTALPQARFDAAPLCEASLAGVQLVLRSPGLAPHDARIAPLLAAARAAGVAVHGELDLFTRALADLKDERGYAPLLLAVTGTNGKTTVTSLAALLVERAGRRVAAAGNIGPTMLDTLAAALDAADDEHPLPEVWVLELSSFQLEAAALPFEPAAAVVLNVTQDHLDWHGGFDAYAAAKARVYGQRAVMVVNRDDPVVEAMAAPPPAAKPARGRAAAEPRPVVRFGLDAPRHAGDFGLIVEQGMAWLVRAVPADDAPRRARRGAADDEELHLQRLMPADALRIRGRHNAANALAALALATAVGCPLAPMLHGLREYRGEPHRVQPAGRVGEVDAYDDSKGTNVGATVAALRGLGADQSPGRLVVILGGDGKGQDFAPLAGPLARHARAVALIGRDAAAIDAQIGAALRDAGVVLQAHAGLEAATAWCFEVARPGDAVLLSPACASLDMFRDYAHRAEVFVAAVHALAAERGEVA
ncbi:UDP-N-acetylmuramoyl-L-alanine--D-glutamate ligase [Azohydromonas sp.]|uniref:UDP-N-acetylmuramoyl-L-alanine--D-glutamate ligase n=1 Tax=Azohydromonas sp. TaxID=1872666 RepID=UPI002B696427|nr:UDP-N-acetylmuramoyl-L-alanine--D-glutamate ligase [Azohydromonas sp.]HMM87120.1 UDP-N-acetylmuramoyl-L-alanine--D-glutamate ligase [Azohydromonas sp.]